MEKIGLDVAMNSFATVTDAEYVYVELANGSQGKMRKDYLASVLATQIGLDIKNIRKQIILDPNQIVDLGVIGGLVVFNTINLQEQCVALFSCYGDSSIELLSSNTSFIIGTRITSTQNKLILFREDSTNSCYIKNSYSTKIRISYQIVGGLW